MLDPKYVGVIRGPLSIKDLRMPRLSNKCKTACLDLGVCLLNVEGST